MDTTHPNGPCSERTPCLDCSIAFDAPMRGEDEPWILLGPTEWTETRRVDDEESR